VNSKDVEKNILEGTVAFCQAPVAPMNAKTTTTYETTIARERSARISLRKRPRYLVQENQTFINSDGLQICGGVMKPGVTMFGEALNNNVKTRLESDRKKVDALIVIGTSLSV
jgi:NAD-dependent histone deacetylase SIR2